MARLALHTIVAVAVAVLLGTARLAAAEYKVGNTVVVVDNVPLKDADRVVDHVEQGFTLVVLAVDDRRLWVESHAAGWLEKQHVIPLQRAAKHFTGLIEEEPLAPGRWQARGKVYVASGNYDAAIEDFDEAIFLLPTWPGYYGDRGHAHLAKRDYDRALKDYAKAVEYAPDNPEGYCSRGVVLALLGKYVLAKADYDEALRLDRDYAEAMRNLAQLLACCPDKEWRDGSQAVKYATKACERSKWRNPSGLHVLACAQAESGNYAEAVRWEEKAIALTPPTRTQNRKILNAALRRFKSGQPYHELTRLD